MLTPSAGSLKLRSWRDKSATVVISNASAPSVRASDTALAWSDSSRAAASAVGSAPPRLAPAPDSSATALSTAARLITSTPPPPSDAVTRASSESVRRSGTASDTSRTKTATRRVGMDAGSVRVSAGVTNRPGWVTMRPSVAVVDCWKVMPDRTGRALGSMPGGRPSGASRRTAPAVMPVSSIASALLNLGVTSVMRTQPTGISSRPRFSPVSGSISAGPAW